MPKRIQRQRTKGWTMPKAAVYVGRPTKWGNPAQEGLTVIVVASRPGEPQSLTSRPATREDVVEWFADCVDDDPLRNLGWTLEDARRELGGKDLACWCPLVDADGNPAPCHADVLLEISNRGAPNA